ncbi:MAG: response regulator transcription factor [Microthrixaceae bacterium]
MSAGRGNTLIVDDEPDVRLLLLLVINKENEGLQVVGEAASGDEAIELRRELDVDIVVLDHRMPGRTGLETAREMLAERPELPILLYSAFTDQRMIDEAEQIGIRECIEKGDARRLVTALRELAGLDAS